MKHMKKIAVLAAVAATALLVASVAFGAPGDDGKVKLCSVKYGPHRGEVRLMDSSTTACHSSEQSVTLVTFAASPTPTPTPTPTPATTVTITKADIRAHIQEGLAPTPVQLTTQEELDLASEALFEAFKKAGK